MSASLMVKRSDAEHRLNLIVITEDALGPGCMVIAVYSCWFYQEDGETCSQGRNQMRLCAKFKQ